MSPIEIRNDIVGFWKTNFTTVPTEYIGFDFDESKRDSTFVQFSIGFGDSYAVGKGNSSNSNVVSRDTGMIRCVVKVPLLKNKRKVGDIEALTIASEIKELLEYKRYGSQNSIVNRTGTIHNIGVVDEYYNVAVSVPFTET